MSQVNWLPNMDPQTPQRFGRSCKSLRGAISLVLAASVLFLNALPLLACPFCNAPQLTLAEQIARSDAAIIGEWTRGVVPDFDAGTPGSTVYRIEKVIRPLNEGKLEVGQEITVDEYFPGETGQFAVITGTTQAEVSQIQRSPFSCKNTFQSTISFLLGNPQPVALNLAVGELRWQTPLDISKAGFDYVANAPSPENNPEDRLRYFVKYLEASDPLVADDAYAEFANAPYATIAAVKDSFPIEKIRTWVFSEETSITRLGLYGLMLGLAGDESDLPVLKKTVSSNEHDFRLGIDGVMAGYLLLGKESALEVIEETKLKPSLAVPRTTPFSETFAALQALKFMWEYAPGVIPPERLQASMRILLNHPDLADLIIIDLARWKDWTLLPRLKEMYVQEEYDIPAIKRAIVGYLIETLKQRPEDPAAEVPEYVAQAEEFMKKLEEEDPKTVKTARLLFR